MVLELTVKLFSLSFQRCPFPNCTNSFKLTVLLLFIISCHTLVFHSSTVHSFLSCREVFEFVLMPLYQLLLIRWDRVVTLVLRDRDQNFLSLLLLYLIFNLGFVVTLLALQLRNGLISVHQCIGFLLSNLIKIWLEWRLQRLAHEFIPVHISEPRMADNLVRVTLGT